MQRTLPCALVLVWVTVVPAVAEEWIEPDLSGRLEPCCANAAYAYPPLKSLVGREMPDHSLLPPEERARRKAAAVVRTDLPRGRRLLEAAPEGFAEAKDLVRQRLAVRGQFEGLDFLRAGETFPPDTMVAASPGRVLEATNVALRLTDRDGGRPVERSLENFFGQPTGRSFHFDPKVYYDRLSSRFFIVDLNADFVHEKSFIYLAVSRGEAPADLSSPDSWCTYRINSRVGASWADYPGLGANEKYLAVSVNNFSFRGPFRSSFVYALDKQRLVANAATCPGVDFVRFKAAQDGHGQVAFTVQPAQHYSASGAAGTPLFLVSSDLTLEITRDYTLWRIVERASGRPGLGRFGLSGGDPYTFPPNAAQRRGPELDTGDTRIQQVAFRNGVVWAVHATGCNFGATPGESCVRVVGIAPSDDGGSLIYEEIFGGGDGWFLWMPGVAVNAADDVAVAFQRSQGSMSAGLAFAGKPAASGSFEALSRLINGRCGLDNFDGNDNRTGDYVGIQTDPADDRGFWIAGEYSGSVSGRGCNWRTRVARVSF